jgi:hypothetical protein
MRSPVSRRASGEGNAITVRGCGHSGLTFVSSLETTFGASRKPVSGRRDEAVRTNRLLRIGDSSPRIASA